MRHPSGCYAKLLRFLQLSKFTFFNAKIWLQLLRVPYNTPMCGQPMHRLHSGPVSTSALAPRFVGRGERHATPYTYRPVLGALRRVEKCSPASGGARLLRLTTPSSLRSFDPAPPCRAASSSPHIADIQPLALINLHRGRAVACECIKIHLADFDTHASH